MTLLSTRTQKLGNVLKWETWIEKGWCRKEIVVTMVAGMDVGAVLEETSVGGKGTWVAAATAANASCILIDDTAIDLAAGDHTLVVLYRGPAIVADDALLYNGAMTTGELTTAATALAAILIEVEPQV